MSSQHVAEALAVLSLYAEQFGRKKLMAHRGDQKKLALGNTAVPKSAVTLVAPS